jgi:hypothetical protein
MVLVYPLAELYRLAGARLSARATRSGRYQVQWPRSFIVAGTSSARTCVASSRDGHREADAELLQADEAPERETREGGDHDQRRGGDDAPGVFETEGDAVLVFVRAVSLLAHAPWGMPVGRAGHLAVHREAEEDREQEDRDPAVDLGRAIEAEQRVAPAVLEGQHEHSAVMRAGS